MSVHEGWLEEGTETATDGDSRNREFYITGVDTYEDARTQFESHASFQLQFDGKDLQQYRLRRLGEELWKASPVYNQRITQSQAFSVDTTGQTLRLTHGFSETRYGPGGDNTSVPPQDAALNI
ncbi:MAG: hypothetical protein AAGJ83_01925, partial [Planctomycetota bacterium]